MLVGDVEIKNKDFSMVLPELIAVVRSIAFSITRMGENEDIAPVDVIGFGVILHAVAEDLKKINFAINSDIGSYSGGEK